MTPVMGCVIVTYNSADHIGACLDSLAAAEAVKLKLVVVDNASADDTVARVQDWAAHHHLELSLIEAQSNLGFAAGVNLGLRALLHDPELDRFWILNPDCTVPPATPAALASVALPFALLGNRLIYDQPRSHIQIDGGQINRWTGATRNLNIGKDPDITPLPEPEALDFISGASMVASRDFIRRAGLMPERYFLYYEEVDWASKRGPLPLALCDQAPVYHQAGASIGSPTLRRGPSPLSAYFKHRARMMFMASHYPARLPVAYLFGWAKLVQHALRREIAPIPAVLRALHGLPLGQQSKTAATPMPQAVTKQRIRSTSS